LALGGAFGFLIGGRREKKCVTYVLLCMNLEKLERMGPIASAHWLDRDVDDGRVDENAAEKPPSWDSS
jgi:hypothetical protein